MGSDCMENRAAQRSSGPAPVLRLSQSSEPAHELLHHVAAHVAVEQRLFFFLGQCGRFGKANFAQKREFGLRDQLSTLWRGQSKTGAQAQLKLAHLASRIETGDDFLALLAAYVQK